MRVSLKQLTLLFLLATLTNLLHAQSKQVLIDSLIRKAHRLGLFNGNLLVVESGCEIYRKSIGYADAARKTKLTDKYRFHIGSIAKEFNAVGIMMLKEQGKLSLDDKVSQYLPQLPEWAGTIRIKNLLQYASGLPDLNWRNITGDAAAIDSLKKVTRLDFEPGTRYAYNNSNILIQRQIIEKITGLGFNDFVQRHMLKPLAMRASVIDPDESAPLFAQSFNDSYVYSPAKLPISGWTAVTLDDFYKWEMALQQFRLINPASTLDILTPFSYGKQCGLGGGKMEDNKLVAHIHDGTAYNYQALLSSSSSQKRVVILMTNNKQNNLYDINNAIQNILDGKPYDPPKKSTLQALQSLLDTASGSQILAAYEALKKKAGADYDADREPALNSVGYTLLGKKRLDAAIAVFEYNTKLFPQSGNVFDSLGEAYYIKGDKEKSLLNYQIALRLDPQNEGAKEKIKELQAGGK
ncbi:MAG: serine hydrolase [Chitinophagaceae bacterium]